MRLLLLAFLLLSAPAMAAPAWDAPFELNGLKLMIPEGDLKAKLGPAQREFDGDLRLYGGNLLVRVREGLVVNLSAADEGDAWALGQAGTVLARTAMPEDGLLAAFGEPREIYAKKTLRVLLFGGKANDVGVMVLDGRVVGFMLAEPDMLSPSLMDSGYTPVK